MTNVYLLKFDTDRTVQPEDRHALKEFVGEYLRVTHGFDAPVSIDHLDPADPPVQALLVVD